MQHEILHRLEGRIRIRLPFVKDDSAFQERLSVILSTTNGVRRVRFAAACASLTLLFSEELFSPECFFAELSELKVRATEIPADRDFGKQEQRSLLYKTANAVEAPPVVQVALGLLSFAAAWMNLPALISRSLLGLATIPIIGRGIRTFLDERRPAVEFMDAASVIVLSLESAYFPAGIMVLLIGIGEYIRDFAARKSQGMAEELLSLSQSSAWLVNDESRTRVAVTEVNPGDLVVVYTGEEVPVTGVVEDGSATIIRAGASTNALPVEVRTKSKVPAGSIVLEGKLYLRCTAVRTAVRIDSRMERERRRLLYRTNYQRLALKRAYKVISPILLFSAATFLVSRSLLHAFTIICFDFVTGVRIALPTSVLAFMYRAGKEGVLVKSGAALETLSAADVFIFSRTGVVTAGESSVTEIISLSDHKPEELLALAAAVEYRYHHPAARAIYRYAKQKNIAISERKNSRLFAGLGVQGELQGKKITVGSAHLMRQLKIETDKAQNASEYIKSRGDSVAYIASENALVGLISYRDEIRQEANLALDRLREQGINEIVLTSGDAAQSVERIASTISVDKVISRLSPTDKADLVRDYQLKGLKVVLIGDDVSDALAMAQADLAVAMSSSTDVARYRAEIILTDDNLNHLPDAVNLSREAMQHLRQNMYLVSVPSWLGLILSVSNRIGPVLATVLNNGSVILGAVNGLLPGFVSDQSTKHPLDRPFSDLQ